MSNTYNPDPAANLELGYSDYNFPDYNFAGQGQTYDAFGNVVQAGSAAAASADPTGLAQSQLDVLTSAAKSDPSLAEAIKGFLTGPYGPAAFLAGSALANRSDFFNPPVQKVGFQGTIPTYTATRSQTPLSEQRPEGYRPGQGGITYFTPMQYEKGAVPSGGITTPVTPPGETTPEGKKFISSAGTATTGGISTLTGAGGAGTSTGLTGGAGTSTGTTGTSTKTGTTGSTTGEVSATSRSSTVTDQWIFDTGKSLLQQGVSPQTILDKLARLPGVSQDQIYKAAKWLATSGFTVTPPDLKMTTGGTQATTGGISTLPTVTDQQIFDVGRSLLQQGVSPQTILDKLATVTGATQDQINRAAQWLQTSGYTGLNVPGSKSTIPTRVTRETADTGTQRTPTADEVRLADHAARNRAIQLGAVKDLTDVNPSLKTAIDKILEVNPNYAPNYNDAMVLQHNIKTKGFDKAMLDFFGEKNIPQGVKEFTPAPATQQNWTSKANEYAAKNISPTAALWRDPKSGSGIGVTLDKNGVPSGFTFYDPQGVALNQTAFYADELYRNAEKLGMDLSKIGELGKQLEAKKIGYKPYELYKGTGSDHGIDFNDIARGGLGTAYDWTVDPLAHLKGDTGFTGQKTLQDNINLAADLGLLKYADVTTGQGIDPSRFTPITAGKGESAEQRGFVVYNGKTASWYGSADEAAEAAKNYPGATIYDLSKGTPPGFSAPQAGVSAPGGIETLQADQAVTQRLAQALKESMAQGFTLEQTKQGAMQKLGVTEAQFNAAVKAAGLAPGGAAGGLGSIIRGRRGYAMGGGIEMLAKGRYLKGNGDGVSDSINAKFVGSGQPAALADGEFVIPARVVSELGNGSSDAGARKLYAMLDRVEQRARKAKRGKPSGADRELNKLA